jgi:UDP-2,3-diacylglucosamine pyrophosphatase LpxH
MGRRATRLAVISDLHLGGEPPTMNSRPERLVRFLDGLPSLARNDEDLHLVIAGDFVDFLAIPPWEPFTADPGAAVDKLRRTMAGPFAGVFDALGRFAAAGHRITVLLGNHDLELALPPVQDALLSRLGAPDRFAFSADGRALRIGGALIEHGNRYEATNANDFTGLRAVASALSRGEAPEVRVHPSPGSEAVATVLNPIKRRYPFLDLLKPPGELAALLLVVFEPSLLHHVEGLARIVLADLHHGDPRRRRSRRGHRDLPASDPQLAEALGETWDRVRDPRPEKVPVHRWFAFAVEPGSDGLAACFERGEPVPPRRLRQIRLLLRRLLLDDRSSLPDGPTGPFGLEAARLLAENKGAVATVVMGHTHQARHVGPADRAAYLNTGTWADVIRVPAAVLADGADDDLQEFLRGLWRDERPEYPATWGDLRIEADGAVSSARLKPYT